jgi:trk system potassium uptake protein TrkA
MGQRVAHLITGRMMDFIEFEDGFAIAKINAPADTHNLTLAEAHVRSRHGVTIVGVKRLNEDFQHALPDTRILPADVLIVSGPTRKIELFASATGRSKQR